MRDAGASSRAVALVPVLSVIWGLNWPAVRIVLDEVPPWTLRAGGLLAAGVLLIAFNLVAGRSLRVRRAHWGRLAVVGLLSVVGFNMLAAFAQLSASTSRAAIVTFTMPVWATILARIFLAEPFDGRRIAGLVLGAAGLAALGWPLIASGNLSWGLLFALGAGLSWAAGTTVLKRFPIDAAPLAMATWQVVFSGVAIAAGMLAFEGWPALRPLSDRSWVALAYHVLFAQALANVLWFEIVTRIPSGIASLGTLLVPGIGVIGATIVLGERPTGTDLLGLALIVAASAAVLLPSFRRASKAPRG